MSNLSKRRTMRSHKSVLRASYGLGCRTQLDAALAELESFRLELPDLRKLQQIEITTACAHAYVRRVEPDAVQAERYPWLDRLSAACEMRQQFLAWPQ